ncbi:TetR/AcrR family transcriptional regulator [Anaerobranca gottschalkii]|uniref:Transcriptional regulator, TetR family n=1 Tax=Anaerobranca gottschalkii DSM 13577 TaxID=1120990 RepID=A0A1H9ZZF9_9FIRM|nr:TetR/AcrR family transcriptional regulator [Anaerobranca gottschalkii]SES87221.1 transcriptional regulator, TetR family [Anaerobranca gottschalkii DSM 13577]
MLEKFHSLDEEKRTRIINAGLKEFGLNGYKNARTDNIVQEAGISKGLLFHYFGTKKKFFEFLLDYAIKISEELLEKINLDADVFVRLRENTLMKMELLKKNPDLFNFLITISEKDEEDIKRETKKKLAQFSQKAYEKMFSGLDLTKFKDDINPQQGIEIIIWTIEGISNKFMREYVKAQKVQDINHQIFLDQFEDYLAILKKALYK